MCRTNCFPKKGDIITLSQGAISVLIIPRCVFCLSLQQTLCQGLAVLRSPTPAGLGPELRGRRWRVLGERGAEMWAHGGWSLQTLACWGPSSKPGCCIAEVPSGSARATGSPRYSPAASAVSLWSGAWSVLGPEKGGGSVCRPGTCWPRPESGTQRLPRARSSWGPPVVLETRQQRAL